MHVTQDDVSISPKVSASLPIQTTLYDLIAAIGEEVDPYAEDDVVTATTIHLLQTYRVTCVGDLPGVRLLCDAA